MQRSFVYNQGKATREKGRGMTGTYENGIYREGDVRLSDLSGRRRLPVGNDDFLSVVEKSVFVDKSMLIADVLDSGATALLFCRPRRFGKSLNLSMIQRFLEIPSPSDPVARDTAELFEGLAIWDAAGGQYRAHHAVYPVISISLKTAKTDDAAAFLGALAQIVGAEYERHSYVLSGGALSEEQRAYFERVTGGAAEAEEIVSSLEWLSRILTAYHGRRTVVLIDEYDAPVAACYTKPSYHEIVSVLKRWLTGALKGNPMLEFAVLTGVQRISKESIFSDLNNLVVDTPLDVMADERYGFLEEEVDALASYLGVDANLGEAREWYDGYRFGAADVFNPWSVVNFFRSGGVADIYWGNTSSNDVLQGVVESADPETMRSVFSLMTEGGTVDAPLDLGVSFPDVATRAGAVWSLLYLAGYLTTDDVAQPNNAGRVRPLRVPNREISEVYRNDIVGRFTGLAGSTRLLSALHRALVDGDAAALAEELEAVLLNSASFYDLTSENSYHMLLVGLLFGVPGYGNPASNREAGRGRFDIRLIPERAGLPALTLELKFERGADEARLEALAAEALAQIEARAYDAGATESDAGSLRYGIAFSGKSLAVAVERV